MGMKMTVVAIKIVQKFVVMVVVKGLNSVLGALIAKVFAETAVPIRERLLVIVAKTHFSMSAAMAVVVEQKLVTHAQEIVETVPNVQLGRPMDLPPEHAL